jgi:uncharacterized delta-60 repeat protein
MSWRGMTGIVAAAIGLAFLVDAGPAASTNATATERTRCSDAGTALATQPNGRILVGGSTFTNEIIEEPSGAHAHVGDFAVIRYLPNGAIDPTFGRNGRAITDLRDFDTINALEATGGGVIAVGSTGWNEDGSIGDNDLALVRYRPDGRLDRRFGDGGRLVLDLGGDDVATAVAVDRLGRTVVAGLSTHGDDSKAVLLRLTPWGQLDPTFGQQGRRWFAAAHGFHGVEIGSQGRIVAAGATTVDGSAAIVVARFTDDGRSHMPFGGDGKTTTVLPGTQAGSEGSLALRAGRILATLDVTGEAGGRVAAARYLPNGALDPRFGTDGQLELDPPGDLPSVGATAVGPGNRPVLAGTTYPEDFATGQATLTRLDARGRPDQAFGDAGTVAETFRLEYAAYHGVAFAAHGSILAAGWDFSEGHDLPRSDYVLVRYARDGSLDERFGRGGVVFTDVRAGRLACREYDHDH